MPRPWYDPEHPAIQKRLDGQRLKLDLDPAVDAWLAMFSNDVYDAIFVPTVEPPWVRIFFWDKVNDR